MQPNTLLIVTGCCLALLGLSLIFAPPIQAEEGALPDIIDTGLLTDKDAIKFTVAYPTTYDNNASLGTEKLVGVILKCFKDEGGTYPDANSQDYIALYDALRTTPNTVNEQQLAALIRHPQTDITVEDFVPSLGQHFECRLSAVARTAENNAIAIGSDWTEPAVIKKYRLPAAPAQPTILKYE